MRKSRERKSWKVQKVGKQDKHGRERDKPQTLEKKTSKIILKRENLRGIKRHLLESLGGDESRKKTVK